MKRYIFYFTILSLALFACSSCDSGIGEVRIIQKDAKWSDVLLFVDGDRVCGLDPQTGERKILIEFSGGGTLPGAVDTKGNLYLGWMPEDDSGDAFSRKIIRVTEDCEIDKTMYCCAGAGNVALVSDKYIFSDSFGFTTDLTTAYALTDIESGEKYYQDSSLGFIVGNFQSYTHNGKLLIGVNSSAGSLIGTTTESYFIYRDMESGEEEKILDFTASNPSYGFRCSIYGDVLVISYCDEKIVEFWDIATRSLLKRYNIDEVIDSAWSDLGTYIVYLPFKSDGKIYVCIQNMSESDYRSMSLLIFNSEDFSYEGRTSIMTSLSDNNVTEIAYIHNGLLYANVGSDIMIFDIENGGAPKSVISYQEYTNIEG